MNSLGCMLNYAVYDCGYEPDKFFDLFLASGIAEEFGNGNATYIDGMSGIELARAVLRKMVMNPSFPEPVHQTTRDEIYWAGWVLAYYQWESGLSFENLVKCGLTVEKIISMYVLHEADISKFCIEADRIVSKYLEKKPTNLSTIRNARGMSQSELAEASGVKLRMIQLYEQKQNNINKAHADTLLVLARVLGCRMENLLEPEC